MFQLKAVNQFRGFWRRLSRNFKVILIRDAMGRLLSGGEGGGGYWSIFIYRLGASTVEMGLIRSISSAVRMLLALPSGWLTDRTKKIKRLYLVGRAMSIPTSLMVFLARTWPFFILINVWSTISMRVMGPASQIITIDALSDKDRVTGLSLQRTITAIAGIAGPMISAFIINYFGGLESADNLRPLFLIQFLVGIPIFLLLVIGLQEVSFTRESREAGVLRHTFSVFKEVPVLKLLLLRQCVMNFMSSIRMPFLGIYLVDVKGADEFILGWRGTVSTALTVCLSMPVGRLADRIGRTKIAYFGRVFGWVGTLILILTPPTHPEYLIIASFITGFRMLMFIGWTAFTQELVPLEQRGRWSGITMLTNGMIGIVAPVIGGVIWNLNPDYLWWINIFGDALIILPLMIIIGHKASKTETVLN